MPLGPRPIILPVMADVTQRPSPEAQAEQRVGEILRAAESWSKEAPSALFPAIRAVCIRLAEMVAVLLDEMERFFHLGLMRRDRNSEMFHEHHEMIEALARHDGALAEAVAAQQIQAAEKMVVDGLLSSPSLQTLNLGGR